MSRSGLLVWATLAAALGACARDPIDPICPPAGKGDLVITELRGAQSGGDTYGQWVELYNASGGPLDLEGLHVVFTRIDGGATSRAIIRRSLPLADGGYVVIGHADDAMRPSRVDYGMGTDYASAWYTSAGVDVYACDTLVDHVTYGGSPAPPLPTMGTWALGSDPPDAAANDLPANWCTDSRPGTDTTQLGLPGSPGAANPPCATP